MKQWFCSRLYFKPKFGVCCHEDKASYQLFRFEVIENHAISDKYDATDNCKMETHETGNEILIGKVSQTDLIWLGYPQKGNSFRKKRYSKYLK